MEIGDLINLILVLFFAVGAPILGAVSKRRKAAQRASSNPNPLIENVESFFPEDIDEDESFVRNDIISEREQFVQKTETQNITEDNKQSVKVDQPEIETKEKFPIRKAVIFSEILNTKYF